jgi:hypothetical protein
MKKHAPLFSTSIIYNFPYLIRPVRRKAVNDNSIPMLNTILKHAVLMSAAFGVLYVLQSLI